MKVKIKYKEPKIILKPKYNEVWLLKEALTSLKDDIGIPFLKKYNENVFDCQEVANTSQIEEIIMTIRDDLIRILDNIDPY